MVRRPLWALLLPLLVVAWWLRLATVAPLTIGTDGGLAVGLAVGPLHQLFDFNARDVHPPLYYLLLRYWITPAGLSWVSLKWLGAAGGIIAVAAAARWARSAIGPLPGVIACLALALAPSAVIAGASVRDFSCGLGATVASVLAFWAVLRCPKSLGARVALGATTAAASLFWYFHLPIFAVQLALALFWRPARQARISLLLGAAAWLPWLFVAAPPLLGKLVGGVNSFGGNGGGGRPVAEVLAVAGGWYPGDMPAVLVAAAVSAMAALGFFVGWRRGDRRLVLVGLGSAVSGAAMLWYVNGRWDPQAGIDRYGLVVLPFLVVGTSILGACRKLGLLVLALWIALAAPNLSRMPHATPPQPWYPDPALDLIVQHWQRGDAVALESIDRLGYFAVRGGDTADAFAAEDNGSAFRALGASRRIAETIPELESNHTRIWYVDDKDKPGHLLQQTLDASTTIIAQWKTSSGTVRLYATAHGDMGDLAHQGGTVGR